MFGFWGKGKERQLKGYFMKPFLDSLEVARKSYILVFLQKCNIEFRRTVQALGAEARSTNISIW